MKLFCWAVFEKLTEYYDGNDRTLVKLFNDKDKADEFCNENSYLNYFVEKVEID